MVAPSLLLGFVAAALLLALVPGVDTAIVLRAATAHGRRAAVAAALGIALGCLVWGIAVALGLGALLKASELAYLMLKVAGSAYLALLGVRLLISGGNAATRSDRINTAAAPLAAFRQGLFTNLLNPKVGAFYVTLLPQFIPAGSNVAGWSFALACIHIVISLLWFGLLTAAAGRLKPFLARPSITAWLDRLTGLLFIGLGMKLALSARN